MNQWVLPTSLEVHGKEYAIRTDFRVILDIISALNDPDLFQSDDTDYEKSYIECQVVLGILFEDFDSLPSDDWAEAMQKAIDFIDCGIKDDGKQKPRMMDWEQDAPLIIPAVNKALGMEVRSVPYMHWWTFFGGYMEIGDSLYTQVLQIREKKQKHQKLEKSEREFYNSNKDLVVLKPKVGEEQQKELDALNKWL